MTSSLDDEQSDGVLFVERSCELPYAARLRRRSGAEAKASLKRALSPQGDEVACDRPETG